MRGPPHTREPIKMLVLLNADTATAAAAAAKAALKYLQGAGI